MRSILANFGEVRRKREQEMKRIKKLGGDKGKNEKQNEHKR